jgi:hypothetical protein
MNLQLITNVLESPTDVNIQALLDDPTTVFWIDWKQEDVSIVEACERVLQTGTLRAEMVEVDKPGGYEVSIHYGDRKGKVPLSYSVGDVHITLWALNEMLKPDYEIRLNIDSTNSDTQAFVPLAPSEWEKLESKYGAALSRHFYKIEAYPNIITEPLPVAPVKPIVTGRNVHAVHYHEYPNPLNLSAFNLTMELLGRKKAEVAKRVNGLLDKSQMAIKELPLKDVRLPDGAFIEEFHKFPDIALKFLNGRLEGTMFQGPK